MDWEPIHLIELAIVVLVAASWSASALANAIDAPRDEVTAWRWASFAWMFSKAIFFFVLLVTTLQLPRPVPPSSGALEGSLAFYALAHAVAYVYWLRFPKGHRP